MFPIFDEQSQIGAKMGANGLDRRKRLSHKFVTFTVAHGRGTGDQIGKVKEFEVFCSERRK